MQKAYLFKIIGLVQGVFFRADTKRKADELGLTGWVRNCEDGSVEVFAQGKEDALEKLEKWCRKGPPAAEVQHVEREEAVLENNQGFAIRY